MEEKKYGFDTLAIHAGYDGDDATHSVTPPLYMTNAYYYDDTAHAARLFELKEAGNIYTRLQNPTNAIFEDRVCALDGGYAALAFASGHAAIFNVIVNLCSEGDEFVSSINIYGGAINLFGVTLKRLGITVKFVNPDNPDEWEAAITPRTKLLFTEVIGNPNANVADLDAIAAIAHKHGIPFMADNTFPTPYICRPIEHGADLVVYSATKFLTGHGMVMAGVVVDSGKFVYKNNERFPLYNDPDPSYHGMVFADLGPAAFITRLRTLIMRDLGACISPFNSFLGAEGVQTLPLRMERHCSNSLAVAKYLESNPQVERVNHPMLESNKYYELCKKMCPKGASGVFTFEIKGGREAGGKFLDSLSLIRNVANVGDIRTQAVHPATTTHSQLTAEQLVAAGISEGSIRLSVGLENIEDIIADLEQAFAAIK